MTHIIGRTLLLLLFTSSVAFAGAGPSSKLKPTSVTVHAATLRKKPIKKHYYERFYTSSIDAANITGDVATGEEPAIRAAAVEALGNFNGTVVVTDPDTGRILAMVNQKLALSEGAQPCSTIKVAVALAGLSEGVITDDF